MDKYDKAPEILPPEKFLTVTPEGPGALSAEFIKSLRRVRRGRRQYPGGSGLLDTGQVPPTVLNGIRTNEAILGTPLPIIVGQQRLSWKLFWYGAFESWQAQTGGSGLVKGGSTYVYSAAVLGGVCMGPCKNLLGVWSQNGKFAVISYSETNVISGTYSYAPSFAPFFLQDLGASINTAYSVTVNDYGSPGNTTFAGSYQVPLQYTTSPTPGPGQYTITNNASPLILSRVDNKGNYFGTITGGASNAFRGTNFSILGFTNSSNNVVNTQCTQSSATVLTLAVATVPQTQTANAYPQNIQYQFNSAQNGQTVVVNYVTYRYHINENELDVVPLTTPWTITVQNQNGYYGDTGVFYYPSGQQLTQTTNGSGSIAQGYYNPNNGNYEFSSSDAGVGITITYLYNDPNYDKNDPTGKLNLTFYGGGLGQPPWPWLAASTIYVPFIFTFLPITLNLAYAALGYSEICYIASSALYLGYSPVLPQLNFEILGPYSYGGFNSVTNEIISDACPADVIYGLLTNPQYKYNFPAANIDQSLLAGNSSAKAQWIANTFFISAILDSQNALMSVISNWCEAGQVYASWDEGKLKFTPLVDTTTVGNGLTYYPPTQPIIDLDDNDFVVKPNEDPIIVDQSPWQSRWNRVSVRWAVRSNSYNQDTLQVQDEASVQQYGLMPETAKSYEFLCLQSAAQFAANMRLQRFSAIYTTYKFVLKSNFAFLSPGDIITITDGLLGQAGTLFGRTPCRILKMSDNPKEGIAIEAENYPWSVGSAYLNNFQAQIPSNTGDGPQADPGNTSAVIIEIPNQASQYNGYTLYIFANGSNVNWGGFQLWISYDGIDYRYYDQYTGEGKIGLTQNQLPYNTDPDTTNTLNVNMEQSGAILASITSTAWNAGTPPGSGATSLSALINPNVSSGFVEFAGVAISVGAGGGGTLTNSGSQGPLVTTSVVDVTSPGSVGPALNAPTTGVDGGGGGVVWGTPSNVYGPSSGGFATESLFYGSAPLSNNLLASGFSFSIPAYCTITGLQINANIASSIWSDNLSPIVPGFLRFTATSGYDLWYKTIVYDSNPQPPLTPTQQMFGGGSDLGGFPAGTLTPALVNSPAFTISIQVGAGSTFFSTLQQFEINNLRVTIYYATTGTTWLNLPGIEGSASYSNVSLTVGSLQTSDSLVGTAFGFTVPLLGIGNIVGMIANCKAYTNSTTGIAPTLAITPILAGTTFGNAAVETLTTSPTVYSAGNSASIGVGFWNLVTLPASTVNDPTFGMSLVAGVTGTSGHSSIIFAQDLTIAIYWAAGGSATGWQNLQNVSLTNTSYTTCTLVGSSQTQILFCYNFNFQLPFGFVVEGIQASIQAHTASASATISAVLTFSNLEVGAVKTNVIGTATASYTFGTGTSDLWGEPNLFWNMTKVNTQGQGGFGIAFQGTGNIGDTISINSVAINIYGSGTFAIELIAYETATLIGQNLYALSTLHRGLLGSVPCNSLANSTFAQLNQATVTYQIPAQYVNSTVYFKFLSFNAYGYQLQKLSDVQAYGILIEGLAPGAIDATSGALITGTPNFQINSMESVFSAVHGSFGIQRIPSGFALLGPADQVSGIPQWVNITTGAGGGVNDMYIYIPPIAGLYSPSQELYYATPVRNITIPTGLVGSNAGCRVAPTGNVYVTLLQNNVSIGMVNFTTGLLTCTFTFTNSITWNGTTDTFSVTAPASQDKTFAGFWMDIQASRAN